MKMKMWPPLLLLASLPLVFAYDVDPKKLEGLARARVELNRLSEVRPFVHEDIPLYHNLERKYIPGADPELVLLNHYYEELDRIALTDMTRKEINELVVKLGFYKKDHEDDEVPEEFRLLPAKDSPFKDTAQTQPVPSSPEQDAKRSEL